MSFFGQTKGTELEKTIAQLATGEAVGGAMYYALAKVAKEQFGLDDVASEFKKEFADANISDILQQTDEIHYQLDLWAANWYNLKRASLQSENIHFCGICTMCNSDILFSHRATNGKRGNINAFLGIRE
jgi:copper oxidase (laccase) domain-containing protein